MTKKQIIKKLENKKYETLDAMLQADNDYIRSEYQFKISQIEQAILEIKRSL